MSAALILYGNAATPTLKFPRLAQQPTMPLRKSTPSVPHHSPFGSPAVAANRVALADAATGQPPDERCALGDRVVDRGHVCHRQQRASGGTRSVTDRCFAGMPPAPYVIDTKSGAAPRAADLLPERFFLLPSGWPKSRRSGPGLRISHRSPVSGAVAKEVRETRAILPAGFRFRRPESGAGRMPATASVVP